MVSISIDQACTRADIDEVLALFVEYLKILNTDFGKAVGCADSQSDMQNFPAHYAALFLAKLDGEPVAACGLIRVSEQDCELVRLYCRPQGRGHGLGRKISEAACDYAKDNEYKRLVLSTEPIMEHAVKLYKSMGFTDIENYAEAPSACSKYMGLVL